MDLPNEEINASEYTYTIPKRDCSDEQICQRNKSQAIRFFKHDFSVYEELVAEDIVIHGPATGQITRGIEAAKELDMGYAIAYPNSEFTIHDLLPVNDKVIVRWSLRGTHLGERKDLQLNKVATDVPPTNQEIFINGVHIYRFNKEGKIVESWAMWDRLRELEEIAHITITPKSPQEFR